MARGAKRARTLLVISLIAVAIASCSPLASKGTMPPPGPNGVVDASAAPDFIAVAGRDAGIAGYARKEDVLAPGDAPFPVFGDDLRTIVGQMVPGKGFVPAGVDPATVPTRPVGAAPSGQARTGNSTVVLYVRIDSKAQIHEAVLTGGEITDGADFRGETVGAACSSMAAGSRLVLLDRTLSRHGAQVVRQMYVAGSEPVVASLWITIAKDGTVDHGTGIPDWWAGVPAC